MTDSRDSRGDPRSRDRQSSLPLLGQDLALSIVVPIYNEADNIGPFFERLQKTLVDLGEAYEIVCVDDGSTDASAEQLIAQRNQNQAVKIVRLSRNFGKELALTAGLDHACGDAVVVIDADQQDPPEIIPELFTKWREGYDVVYARRVKRSKDTVLKRASASWFYRVYNQLTDVPIPSDTGDFRLMDRRVIKALCRLPERNRFMKGLFSWVGFSHVALDYDRENRASGRSKWNYWSLWNLAIEGITSFSTLPLRLWSYVGFAVSLFAFAYALFLVARTLIMGHEVPGYASLMVVVLFMGGLNLLTLGIIGEYLGRTYMEVKGRPLYLVSERHGFEPEAPASTAQPRARRSS